MQQRAVNDFTIRVATVNGSGSQSSNLILARAIFGLGIPVAPKNVFPSNIEGLPTWFDVRVSGRGYQCRTRDVDLLVALNKATWRTDAAAVRPGGVIVHESSYPVAGDSERGDVTYYSVPFSELAKEHFKDGALRIYLLNMLYVGVLGELLGVDEETVEASIAKQFQKKPKAVESNMNAARIGFSYAREHLSKRDPFALERMRDQTTTLNFIDGNWAAALGAIMGGCTVAAWYPITPSSSLCESFIALADRYRTHPDTGEKNVAVVQAEDELAAIGIVLGAGWAGARAMTSTSGPGLSLMAEWAGYGYFAEIPGVIFDVQRAGPSTGLPTRTMQADVAAAYALSHGDTKHIVLLPATVLEAYEFSMEAFNLAERFQTPIFVLSDLDLGMNPWLSAALPYPEKPFDRGKLLGEKDLGRLESWGRYRDVDHDGIPYRTVPGTNHPSAGYFTRGTGHDEEARYSELPEVWQRSLERLVHKHDTARTVVPAPIVDEHGRDAAILAFGSTHHAVVEGLDILRDGEIDLDYVRVRALPFSPEVAAFIGRHERVYVVEQNRDGQLYCLLRTELPNHLVSRLHSIRHYNGLPIDAHAVVDPLLAAERQPAVVAE